MQKKQEMIRNYSFAYILKRKEKILNMNFIEKIRHFFEKIFSKKEKIKMLEEPKIIDVSKESNKKKEDFIQSLKVKNLETVEKSKISTLICEGDGLGIKPKMSA